MAVLAILGGILALWVLVLVLLLVAPSPEVVLGVVYVPRAAAGGSRVAGTLAPGPRGGRRGAPLGWLGLFVGVFHVTSCSTRGYWRGYGDPVRLLVVVRVGHCCHCGLDGLFGVQIVTDQFGFSLMMGI